jgi:hypothetical protein
MYKTILTDPKTGHVYTPDGTLFRQAIGENYLDRQFPTLERAQKFARGVVRRYPYLECVVFDEAGKEAARHRNDEWLQKEAVFWNASLELHQQQDKRDRWRFLLAMVLFSYLITLISLFLAAKGLSVGCILLIVAFFSGLIWLVITRLR